MLTDRSVYAERWGDPSTWSGDWRRRGSYLTKERQQQVSARLEEHRRFLVGMAIRGHASQVIAASLTVSREAVDRRLRPLGLKNAPGQVGRPAASRVA